MFFNPFCVSLAHLVSTKGEQPTHKQYSPTPPAAPVHASVPAPGPSPGTSATAKSTSPHDNTSISCNIDFFNSIMVVSL
jgi:hypothetical protein